MHRPLQNRSGIATDRAAGGQSLEAERPNVVLIVSDDHAWSDYSFMGHPHVRTPHIDRLARESLSFTRGYVPSSLCCPSLASIITGLYPHQHKVTSNDPPLPPGMAARDFHASDAFRSGRERMNCASGGGADAAADARQAGLREPANRQVVAGGLSARRLYRGHDSRRPPRRRGTGHRPQDDATDLRLHCHRAQARRSHFWCGTRR